MSNFSSDQIQSLSDRIQGRVVLPSSSDYNEVRSIWNAMIDKKPAVIVECAGADDVVHAIKFGRASDLEISIRGVGHNIAGNSVCNDGLMIDLSQMKSVTVDTNSRRAFVDPGATLGDFDAATQEHGLSTPVGINSTTGISGLTLGGGFGWLTRKYGMTVDNVVSAEVVTVDGEKITASSDENSDLFWALLGGGGNFGVVTKWEFQLYPVGPEITAGLIVYPLSEASQVLSQYREFTKTAPPEANAWVVLRHAPPLPFLPEDVHGKEVVVLAVFYAGDPADAEQILAPLKTFGNPHGVHVGPVPYAAWQQAFDPLLTPGSRNYWKSHNFTELSDGALDVMIDYAGKLPTGQCEIFIAFVEGAANRVPADATAYRHRDATYILNVHGRWDDPAEDDGVIAWAREFFDASKPYASEGAYVNFMTEEEGGRVESVYGANYDRLVEIKRKYDPTNVLHLNQNIVP